MGKLIKRLVQVSVALLSLGIILCIVSAIAGVNYKQIRWGNKSTVEVEKIDQTFTGAVNSLKLSICSGEFEVKQGKSLRLIGEDIPKGTLHYSLENGILKVEDTNSNNFGAHFSFFGIQLGDISVDKKITLYIPEGLSLDDIDFDMAAGKSKLENITAKTGKIEMEAGKLDAKNLVISDQATLTMSAGSMDLDKVSIRNSSIDVSAGRCTIDGKVYGDTKATISAGEMKIKTDLKESEYDFNTDATAGSIKINGKSYHEEDTHTGADNSMSLDCSAGSIKVETE